MNKLSKKKGIQQRRTYIKEMKNCRLAIRHFRHPKKRAKARKALKRLRTIAGILIRELRRKLSAYDLFEVHQKDFLFYERVLAQKPKDKNKIYSLHEPKVYCMAKGKDHIPYEYGNKVSIASTAKSNIIVGVVSHAANIYPNGMDSAYDVPQIHGVSQKLGHIPLIDTHPRRGKALKAENKRCRIIGYQNS